MLKMESTDTMKITEHYYVEIALLVNGEARKEENLATLSKYTVKIYSNDLNVMYVKCV